MENVLSLPSNPGLRALARSLDACLSEEDRLILALNRAERRYEEFWRLKSADSAVRL